MIRCVAIGCIAATATLVIGGTALAADHATTVPADAAIESLISQLGDRAPAIRDAAQHKLATIGRPARTALAAAAASGSPQRRAVARELLAGLPLFDANDAKPLRELLAAYQSTPPQAQAQHALRLLSHGDAVGLEAAARIFTETTDDDVLWPFVAEIAPADRDRLIASPAFAQVEPTDCPRLYLLGASLFDHDRPRAVDLLERCLSQLSIATPASRPALLHVAELLATDAREKNEAARELKVRCDAALLVPMTGGVAADNDGIDGVAMPETSDLLLSYLAARVRLHTADGFADDLATLGITDENSVASLVAATIAEPRLVAPPPADNADPADVIRRVPGKIWAAFDALSPDDQATGLEVLYRGGDLAVADAISRRMLVAPQPADQPGPMIQRARVMAIRAALASTPAGRAAAREGVRRALFGQHDDLRNGRLDPQRAGQLRAVFSIWPADLYAQFRVTEVRRAMERHDAAGITAALDALTPVPIDNPTLAIDVVRVFELNGRWEEADEVFDDYRDTAEKQLAQNATSLNSVAWFCARTGRDLKHAYEMASRATALEPENSAIKDTFAEATFRLGNSGEAAAAEAAALRDRPTYDFMIRQLDRFKAGLKPGDAERALPSEWWER